jgi:hypothetical protein
MKNIVSCPNCGTENPFYKLTCSNCKTYLRERIFNVDLWKVIGLLIENPVRAFKLIIHSEHKNFVILINILFAVKAFIFARLLSLLYSGSNSLRINLGLGLLITLGAGIIVIFLYSLLVTFINKSAGLKTRIRDNHAVFSYSLIPHSFALLILFPIEIIIFGGYFFSNNPSPFILKPTIAYALLSFEGLLILWGISLSVAGVYAISKNFPYSVLIGLLFNFYLLGFLSIMSGLLFI